MKYYQSTNVIGNKVGVVVKSWCDHPEEGAVAQALNLSKLPFIYKQVMLMPDCHCGYGMPIGGVMGTQGVVIPNAVGLDIGCGICAVKTSLTEISLEQLKKIMGLIREIVPVGFSHQKVIQAPELMPYVARDLYIVESEWLSARKQLGTLGGGNHFIEIQKGSDGYIWAMVHSGSRNLGKKVADHYNRLAVECNEKWFSSVPKEWQLAFLPLDDDLAQEYLDEMKFCVEFAFANRNLIIYQIMNCFTDVIPDVLFTSIDGNTVLNIAHNYARMENHFGKNVMVHRKGATSAKAGERGIIAGSQGTKSYIVEGLGNPESFMTCSHGAGRAMGRKDAQRRLILADEQKLLDDQGILHAIRGAQDLDEASGAYKDISIVMEEQKDLVKPIVELTPLGVIKG